ncbi:MAG: tetratricopeptide repeat protein [Candidatus Zixiibacteriota bacterium]|nr:MAG: tetratricopeptide repeat protein [candidate division Zixibacteria bacterium]
MFIILAAAVYSQNVKPEIIEALDAGDTTLAIQLLDKDIEFDKGNPWNYYTKGMIFSERGKFRDAVEQFETALDKRSKHFESRYQLGLSYLNLGELDKAQQAMEYGIQRDKKNKHLFEDGLGLVMLARGDYQEADRHFRQALVEDSLNALYHIHLGDANFYQGVPALAVIEYEKALELDTAGLEVYFHWAEACLEMRDYSCAMEKLRVVLVKDTTHAPAWMRAGGIYFKAGLSSRTRQERNDRFREAIGSYKRYLELTGAQPDSSNVRVFFELAMAYSNIYGYEDAADNYAKVLSIPYEPKDVYFHYGKALWYLKDYVRAAEMLQKHLEWVPLQGETYTTGVEEYEVYQFLGDSYFYRDPKDFSGAMDHYKRSLEGNPNQLRVLQNLAICYHSLKSYHQALEYYQKRIEAGIDSTSASIYKNAGYCALNIANAAAEGGDEGDPEEEEDMGDPGGNPDIDYYQLAADYFVNYLGFVSDDVRVLEAVASTYLYRLSDCANGVKYYEQVLALDSKNCEALKSLGLANFLGVCPENYSRALGYFQRAYDCLTPASGECADVDLVLYIAQAYHLRAVKKAEQKQDTGDDFRNANTWYGKCLKCDPGNPKAKEGKDQTEYEF